MGEINWSTIAVQYGILGIALLLLYRGVWMLRSTHDEFVRLLVEQYNQRLEDQERQYDERLALMKEGRDLWQDTARIAIEGMREGVESTHQAVTVGGRLVDAIPVLEADRARRQQGG